MYLLWSSKQCVAQIFEYITDEKYACIYFGAATICMYALHMYALRMYALHIPQDVGSMM